MNKLGRKPLPMPSKKELLKDLYSFNSVKAIAQKKYKVSETTLFNWLKKYDLISQQPERQR